MIDAPGGVSIGAALAQARANIEAKRAEAMTVIDVQIAVLESVLPPANLSEQGLQLNEAYRAANGVIDAASPFELVDLCQAASGLCDLIDSARPDQLFDWRIVTVHARTLHLLQMLPLEETAARNTVLDSLKSVADRKLQPPTA
ncbi:chemotaxis protein CheE [Brevundimonas sp. TWP2-3-4b2]|uniref:chemotaxis protein CheE n=1 Tax=Brevundimonas sp. TWP2-3-4b2 TaxID=2804595 RepID=UPI003CF73C11